jgi:hypothetical protein
LRERNVAAAEQEEMKLDEGAGIEAVVKDNV